MRFPRIDRSTDPPTLVEHLDRAHRRMALTIAAAVAVSLAVTVLVLSRSHPTVVRYTEATKAMRQSHEAMLDQQTALRGFLLTEDGSFLTPFREGQQHLRAANHVLVTRLRASDHTVIERLLDLRLAQEAWAAHATPLTETSAPTTPDAKVAVVRRGKELFDRYRQAQEALTATVVGRRDKSLHDQARSLRASAVIQIMLCVAMVWGIRHQRRALQPAAVEPVAELAGAIDRLRQGDLAARARPDGFVELRQIAEGLNGMAEALARERARGEERAARVADQAAKLREILRLAREVAGSLSLRYVEEAVRAAALSVSGYDDVRVLLTDDSGRRLVPSDGGADPSREDDDRPAPVDFGDGLPGEAAAVGRPVHSDGGDEVALPMVIGGRVVGVLQFRSTAPRELSQEALDVLETLAVHAGTALEAARLHSASVELSRTDPLTQLPNRRTLEEDLAVEVDRSVRYQRPLAAIMLDLDHFKALNDVYGHQRGDRVLCELGRLLRDSIRTSDTAYRYGGEEFTVLVREGSETAAVELAERLRARIEQRLSPLCRGRSVTASLGVAALASSGATATGLIAAADRALYAAKAEGRNRVCVDQQTADAPLQAVP